MKLAPLAILTLMSPYVASADSNCMGWDADSKADVYGTCKQEESS